MAVKTSLSTSTGLILSDIGSVYLDGTGDYLTVPTSSQFSFGTGDFTIECWVYLNSISQGYSLFAMLGDGVDATPTQRLCAWSLYYDNFTPSLVLNRYTPTNVAFSFAWTPSLSRWYHISIARSGTSLRAFINGVQIGTTQTTSQDYSSVNAIDLHIGRFIASGGISYFLNGYISNLRILKGTAAYIGNFIPPTSPLITNTSTSLLTCQGPTLRDDSSNNFTITQFGNAAYNNTSPFMPILKENVIESGSIYFNGSSYLSVPYTSIFDFGSGNFTVELWLSSTNINQVGILALPHNASNYAPVLLFGASTTNLTFYSSSNGTSWDIAAGTSIGNINTNTNVWNHVAISKNGSSIRLFLNGSLSNTVTFAGTFSGTYDRVWIGDTAGNSTYTGYISNLRMVKGTAVYTSNFTPQPPLDNIPNTQLLLQSTTGSLWLKDDSINNLTITAIGDAAYSSLSPETAISGVSLRQAGLIVKELDEITTRVSNGFYSAVFDGTGDYLTIPSNYTITGDFTAEAFVYNTGNNDPCILGTLDSANSQLLRIVSNVQVAFFASTITGTITVPKNQWVHLAVSRQGTTVRLFTNGVLSGTPATYGGNVLFRYIGALGVGTDLLTGYVSNLRVINGTAIYTANFSVPTSPLTAVNNTVLLTCQDATLRDNSTNNYTITANGNAAVDNLTPFPLGVAQKQMSDGTLMIAQFSEVIE
jgi:hypothetical protein